MYYRAPDIENRRLVLQLRPKTCDKMQKKLTNQMSCDCVREFGR